MSPLESAIACARRGWPVFPIHEPMNGLGCSCGDPKCDKPAKHPRTEHGFKDATTNEDMIRAWWKQWPTSNVGMATGAVSGTVVLDVDPRHGGEDSLLMLEARHGRIPDTVEAKTGGGGRHIVFAYPGRPVSCRIGLDRGLDRKADGGYIVIEPSLHSSGKRYAWDAGLHPDVVDLADPPAWLLEDKEEKRTASTVEDRIREGSRNAVLASIAGSMRRKGLGPEEIAAALLVTNSRRCSPPLPEAEVRKIAESVSKYEPGDPVINEQTRQREPGEDGEERQEKKAESILEVHFVNPPDPVVEKPQAFIDGIAFRGYTIASGPPKHSKKTWFFIAESLSIHTGTPFLGRPTNKANCAWLQLDMAEWDFQDYVGRIARGMDIPESPMPYLFCASIDLARPEQWKPIASRLKALGTQVLYVDSCRAASNVDENDSAEVKKIVRGFFCGVLRNETDISTVLIAHTPKGANGARGSGEWTGGADCDLRFQPNEDGKPGPIKVVGVGRHADLEINFEFEDLGDGGAAIHPLTAEESWKKRQFSPIQLEAAHQYVVQHPQGASQNDILYELQYRGMGLSRTKGRAFLDAVRERYTDLAERTETKRSGRPARVFFVPESNGSGQNGNHYGEIIEETL